MRWIAEAGRVVGAERHEFGEFRLYPSGRRLETAEGATVALTAKAFDALVCLVEHAGELVSRRALFNAVWPDRVVDENNLNQVISALRRVLGESYVATVPGRGYQFVVAVRSFSAPEEAAAVPECVSSPSPAWTRRAAFIGGGSLLLVALALGATLWQWDDERGHENIEVQREIARSDARPAQVSYSPSGRTAGGTASIDALEHYSLAVSLIHEGLVLGNRVQAVAELEQALHIDPEFGLAQIVLARNLEYLAVAAPDRFAERYARAVDQAIELAPELPEALALVAQKHTRERQWRMAEQAHRERLARSSLNDYWAVLEYGEFLVEVGRAQESLQYLERARSINPVMAVPILRLAMAHDALGHRARAFELHRNAQRFVAYDFTGAMGHFWRMLGSGDSEGARRFLADFFEIDLVDIAKAGDMPSALADSPSNRMLITAIVHLDDRAQGLAELRAAYADPRMGHWVGMLNMALLAAHFDDPELSLAALRRAAPHAPSGHGIWSFVWIPLMQPVRAHPEFENFVRESELPSYWREAGWPEHCRPLGDDDFDCA